MMMTSISTLGMMTTMITTPKTMMTTASPTVKRLIAVEETVLRKHRRICYWQWWLKFKSTKMMVWMMTVRMTDVGGEQEGTNILVPLPGSPPGLFPRHLPPNFKYSKTWCSMQRQDRQSRRAEGGHSSHFYQGWKERMIIMGTSPQQEHMCFCSTRTMKAHNH